MYRSKSYNQTQAYRNPKSNVFLQLWDHSFFLNKISTFPLLAGLPLSPGPRTVFYNQSSAVTCHHFCPTLLTAQTNRGTGQWEGTREGSRYHHQLHLGPFWNLAPTSFLRINPSLFSMIQKKIVSSWKFLKKILWTIYMVFSIHSLTLKL